MTTYYVAPKGTVSGANNGTSPANAWNGINACRAGMGSTSAGDTIVFRGDLGPYSFADQADFAYQGTLSGAHSFVTGQSGCYIGSSSTSVSNASGRIFQFLTGAYGQATIDMHRSDANHTASQRMYSALQIQGEGITILNARVIAPNFNYLPGIPGPGSQAEAMSQENYGLRVVGNGITIDGGEFLGYADTQGFCRAALQLDHQVTGTDGLKTTVRNIRTFGAHFGLQCVIQGASTLTKLVAVLESIRGEFPSWGSTASTGLITGNAGTHGGHVSLSSMWGSLEVRNSAFSGVCQDAIDLITVNGTVRNCTIDDVYAPSVLAWTWNAGTPAWELTTVSGVTGNGIKMGLNGYTGTSPSTWGGTDGTPGGVYNVAEFNNRALGNKIRNVSIGITSNAGNGLIIHANEVTEAYAFAVALNSATVRSNFWVSNNYGQLSSSAITNARALTVTANANIILLNNIFDCQKVGGASSVYDLHWLTALTPLSLNKNLYVRGTVVQTQPYPGTGDISPVNPSWVQGVGLPSGSALIGAGAHNGYCADAHGVQFKNPPSIGAYEYITARTPRS